jgi:hypothetical protein
MHGSTRPRPAANPSGTGISAVVWIEPGRALVVRGEDGAELASYEVMIPDLAAVTPPALAEVAHSIGNVDCVLVIGTDDLRTALEREIVAIGHHPETIREGAIDGPVDEAVLIDRLRRLG